MAIFDPLLNALGWVLARYYDAIPNLGLDIILLTFTIMLVLYPLTAKQAKSMIRMQMVQPEIKRIQAKYKHDKAKLNEEMMAFYQENKINPLAGCLPLLIQMPIFFALFRTLRDTYKHVPQDSSLFRAICTNPKTGNVIESVDKCGKLFDGKHTPPAVYDFLGLKLSLSAPDQIGTWATVMAFGLVVFVMFTGYMQSRQAQKRTPAANKQMAMITKILPVFFGFISLNFPSGLVVYFAVSNLWRLGQQEVIFRRIGTAADPKHRSLQGPAKGRVVDADSREVAAGATATAELEGGDAAEGAPAAGTKAPEGGPNGNGTASGGMLARMRSASNPPPERPTPATARRTAPSGKPVAAPPKGSGGLKGLFQLPPPSGPPVAQPPAPARAARPASKATKTKSKSKSKATTTTEVTERPGQAGRRTSKKKRKR